MKPEGFYSPRSTSAAIPTNASGRRIDLREHVELRGTLEHALVKHSRILDRAGAVDLLQRWMADGSSLDTLENLVALIDDRIERLQQAPELSDLDEIQRTAPRP